MTNKVASFTYYGSDKTKNRTIRFYKNRHSSYTCDVEGIPSLTITHPSKVRVRAAFEGWWQMAQKDWGASEIDWGDQG